jgi:hypothetical protein
LRHRAGFTGKYMTLISGYGAIISHKYKVNLSFTSKSEQINGNKTETIIIHTSFISDYR